jgi:hypothetical protein
VAFRVNGLPVVVSSPFTWQNDLAPHATNVRVQIMRVHLPLIAKEQ